MGLLDKILRRRRRESDQLPEEGPAEQVVDDLPEDARPEARPEATSSPGGAGPGAERRTGHPDEAKEND
jgi:hypothetical protein